MARQFFGRNDNVYRVVVEYQEIATVWGHQANSVVRGVRHVFGPYATQGGATQMRNKWEKQLQKRLGEYGFELFTLERQIATGWKIV